MRDYFYIIGSYIIPRFSNVDIWDDSLFNSIGVVNDNDILLIIENSFKRNDDSLHEKAYKKLNVDRYVKVLSRGITGWVHKDNCRV